MCKQYNSNQIKCPKCGSTNIHCLGATMTDSELKYLVTGSQGDRDEFDIKNIDNSAYQNTQYVCKDCGTQF